MHVCGLCLVHSTTHCSCRLDYLHFAVQSTMYVVDVVFLWYICTLQACNVLVFHFRQLKLKLKSLFCQSVARGCKYWYHLIKDSHHRIWCWGRPFLTSPFLAQSIYTYYKNLCPPSTCEFRSFAQPFLPQSFKVEWFGTVVGGIGHQAA